MKELTTINLDKVSNKEYFKNELDFNEYLTTPEGMEILSNKINIELKNPERERIVEDNKRIDILYEVGRDEEESYLILESQFNKGNHDHLGKLISYASQSNKYKYIVWIVEETEGIYTNAINTLNRAFNNADSPKYFYLLKANIINLEGTNKSALNLDVIENPDDLPLISISSNNKVTATRQKRLEFWEKFEKYCNEINYKLRKITSDHWNSFTISNKIKNITQGWFTILIKSNLIRVGVDINKNPKNTNDIEYVENLAENFFNYFSDESTDFTNDSSKKTSTIYLEKEIDFDNYGNNEFEWLINSKNNIEKFLKVELQNQKN